MPCLKKSLFFFASRISTVSIWAFGIFQYAFILKPYSRKFQGHKFTFDMTPIQLAVEMGNDNLLFPNEKQAHNRHH